MSQSTAKVQEPSMEEILASIRRIISDETAGADAPRPAAPIPLREVKAETPASAPSTSSGPMSQEAVDALLSGSETAPAAETSVLELTEAMEASAPVRAIDAADVVFREEQERDAPADQPREIATRPASGPANDDAALMSAHATAAVSAAFDSLTHAFFAQSSHTVEDLVREMLRPMLRHWLDDNLPGLVERMVRAEIERVARGGRR
jgi:cell pole-organizing protein PopZ